MGREALGAHVNMLLVVQTGVVVLLAHIPSCKDTSELMPSDFWSLMPDWQ